MADFSLALETSANYGGFSYARNGRLVITADATGNASERIYGKDITLSDSTHYHATFWLDTCQINCGTNKVALYDGSAGAKILGAIGGDSSVGYGCMRWDFRQEGGIACLTADNTSSLCVSATNGNWNILITGSWGS